MRKMPTSLIRKRCNRLQADDLLALIARFSVEIKTLQFNHPENVSYRVLMQWEDRDAKPKYGYIWPSKIAVKCSPSLTEAIKLAYTEICIQAGKVL